ICEWYHHYSSTSSANCFRVSGVKLRIPSLLIRNSISYAKLYGKDSPQLAKVKEVLYGVFDEYNLASKNATSSTSGGGGSAINSQVDEGDGGTSQRV
ncbi:hypothetical protein Tco_1013827, partial [Tanacetum coccineum]